MSGSVVTSAPRILRTRKLTTKIPERPKNVVSSSESDFNSHEDGHDSLESTTGESKKKRSKNIKLVKTNEKKVKKQENSSAIPDIENVVWEPENWRETLDNIMKMRKMYTAPVDSMGSDQCADKKVLPKEIVCKKPTGKKKVDSRLVLALKTKKKTKKKIAPSFKSLDSESLFLSTNRLTNRLGLFCKGKASSHVKRVSDATPMTKARAEQNLQKVLQIVSEGDGTPNMKSPPISIPGHRMEHPLMTVETPSIAKCVAPHATEENSPYIQMDARSSSGTSSSSLIYPVNYSKEVVNFLFNSVSNQLRSEIDKCSLGYWDRSSYSHLTKILTPKSTTSTPLSNLLDSSVKLNPQVPSVSSFAAADIAGNNDSFVLNINPDFRKTTLLLSSDPVQDRHKCLPTSTRDCMSHNYQNSVNEIPVTQPFQKILDKDFSAWEPEDEDQLTYLRDEIQAKIADTISPPLCHELPLADLSPVKPPTNTIKTPKVFFRCKMF